MYIYIYIERERERERHIIYIDFGFLKCCFGFTKPYWCTNSQILVEIVGKSSLWWVKKLYCKEIESKLQYSTFQNSFLSFVSYNYQCHYSFHNNFIEDNLIEQYSCGQAVDQNPVGPSSKSLCSSLFFHPFFLFICPALME